MKLVTRIFDSLQLIQTELGSGPLTEALLIVRSLEILEHLLQRMTTDQVLSADLTLESLLDQSSSAKLHPNLRVAVHHSPVSAVGSLRNQLVSRGSWVWLFSASVYIGESCGIFKTPPHVAIQNSTKCA
jgi:hypothetical protein